MAADINSVIIVGRLTRDIEIRYTPSGTPVGRLGVANTRRAKKGETWIDETNFFDVTLFGKSAESLSPYLLKGQQVCVQGELRFEQWEKDGVKANRVSIVANTLQLLGSRNSASQGASPVANAGTHTQTGSHNSYSSQAGAYAPNGQPLGANASPTTHVFDEDIPF